MARTRNKYRLPAITETMSIRHPLAAGIDIGSRWHAVAIPPHLTEEPCRQFGSTTPDLQAMAAWLLEHGITTVAMESTGNYWVQPLRLLQDAGLEVILVHPAYARQAKRTKYSDLDDSVWLQQMHAYGLLPASFLPPPAFQRLRALWRFRDRLVADQARYVQLMQNALTLMNVQVHQALSDVTGATGLAIIRAIVAGERSPAQLARHRDPHCRCTPEELTQALTGDYREEEVFVLGETLACYDFTLERLAACDMQIEAFLQAYLVAHPPTPQPQHAPAPTPAPAPRAAAPRQHPTVAAAGMSRKRRSKLEPTAYDWHATLVALCGVDATRITGLSVLHVLALTAELGVDLSAWRTSKQFTAWLGLAPDHRVSSGKVLKRHTRRGKPRAAHVFYQAALAVAKSHTPLGDFYRYHRGRIGPAKALTATARKLAELYYRLLTYGPDFVAVGVHHLQQRTEQRKRRTLRRLAQELGVTLVEPAVA